jgi:ADP-heptose:LPS heptosyltransferase
MTLLKPYLIVIKSLLFYLFDSMALLKAPSQLLRELELVLLIRQDAIGDFIIWLDTAKEYRKLYPPEEYKIILAGNKIWCDLAEDLPYWDEVLAIDVNQFKTFSRYRWNFLRKVRNLGIQISIQPTFSREFYNGDAIVRASQASRKISSVGDMRNRNWLKQFIADSWHTELIPASKEPLTELERNAEFFSGFQSKQYLPSYPKMEVSESWEIQELNLEKYYVLSLGADKSYRLWPLTSYAKIAQLIYEKTGWKGLICGTEKEVNLGEQIQKICYAPLKNYAGRTSLQEFAWLLAKSQLLISNESGSAHTASAVRTETVCILGGGHYGRFAPYPDLPGQTNFFNTVFHKMPCYGCNWECVFTFNKGEPAPCIANVSVEAVWKEVEKTIEDGVKLTEARKTISANTSDFSEINDENLK